MSPYMLDEAGFGSARCLTSGGRLRTGKRPDARAVALAATSVERTAAAAQSAEIASTTVGTAGSAVAIVPKPVGSATNRASTSQAGTAKLSTRPMLSATAFGSPRHSPFDQ